MNGNLCGIERINPCVLLKKPCCFWFRMRGSSLAQVAIFVTVFEDNYRISSLRTQCRLISEISIFHLCIPRSWISHCRAIESRKIFERLVLIGRWNQASPSLPAIEGCESSIEVRWTIFFAACCDMRMRECSKTYLRAADERILIPFISLKLRPKCKGHDH